MVAHASAVLDRARRHRLLTVAGAVFHQRATEVPSSLSHCTRQVLHAISDVGVSIRELCSISLEAKHCRGARHDLYDADLTGLADRARIIRAFYEGHSIDKLGRHDVLARPLLKDVQVQLSFQPDGSRQR